MPNSNLPDDLVAVNSNNEDGNYCGATLDFELDVTLTVSLRIFTRSQQVSLFTFLLTAYQIVIARYSGRDRFLVTTPTSVRHLAGWAGIGPLAISSIRCAWRRTFPATQA